MDIVGGVIARVWRRNPWLGNEMYYYRERLRGEQSWPLLERFVSRGDVVVDIGANIGLFTQRLLKLAGPTGHVHAFEPDPRSLKILERIRGNRRNLTIHALALSDAAGQADLEIPVIGQKAIHAMASLEMTRQHRTVHHAVKVKLDTLDAALPPDGPPVRFIKCDVEGHERAMLQGAETTLRRNLPTLLIEIEQRHQAAPIKDTFNYILGLGYSGFYLHRTGVRPLREFDVERDQLALLGTDMLNVEPPSTYVHDFLFTRPGDNRVMC